MKTINGVEKLYSSTFDMRIQGTLQGFAQVFPTGVTSGARDLLWQWQVARQVAEITEPG